ncbi:MAG TPA: S41 family peptidase [Bacteroidales bacterium]|nr:S41 family peptidase [Bacteroidales bacterium]
MGPFSRNVRSFFYFLSSWIVIFTLTPLAVSSQAVDPRETIQKIAATLQLFDYFYVDTVNQPELVEKAIIEMLEELDPHSVYISKEDVKKADEPLVGNFDGIGVQFQIFKDTILVIAPVPGGPSEKLGIMAGDKIVKINGEDATGKDVTNEYVQSKLRGQKGTRVEVSIYRKGRSELLTFSIIRDKIPVNSLDAAFMAAPEIGYIKLNRFSKTTMDEFHQAMDTLRSQGMTKLILDLRYNTGGYLETAQELADEFLGKGKMIVYTEGLKSPKTDLIATEVGSFEKGQLVILINEGSASASEIVAGAVQDWDRGIIIGRRSFGKGLVQKPFRLPDESVIRLTTAKYFTPTGRCIQKPYDDGLEEYQKDFQYRVKKGELVHADSIHFPDSLKYYTPAQRVVYGGGGIMPDIFIPFDSTDYSDYYVDLRRKNTFNDFTLQYLDDHRKELQTAYKAFKDFNLHFNQDVVFLKEFTDYAEKEGVKYDPKGMEDSEDQIFYVLKALIARNLFDYNAYFEVISSVDDDFTEAVKILQDGTMFKKFSINY